MRRSLQTALLLVASALLAASTAACGGMACNDMGCSSSITLQFHAPEGATPSRISGAITVKGEVHTFDCIGRENQTAGNFSCGPDYSVAIFQVAEARAKTVAVSVSADGGTYFFADEAMAPKYTVDDEFNGPGCGSCTTGSLAVPLRPSGAN